MDDHDDIPLDELDDWLPPIRITDNAPSVASSVVSEVSAAVGANNSAIGALMLMSLCAVVYISISWLAMKHRSKKEGAAAEKSASVELQAATQRFQTAASRREGSAMVWVPRETLKEFCRAIATFMATLGPEHRAPGPLPSALQEAVGLLADTASQQLKQCQAGLSDDQLQEVEDKLVNEMNLTVKEGDPPTTWQGPPALPLRLNEAAALKSLTNVLDVSGYRPSSAALLSHYESLMAGLFSAASNVFGWKLPRPQPTPHTRNWSQQVTVEERGQLPQTFRHLLECHATLNEYCLRAHDQLTPVAGSQRHMESSARELLPAVRLMWISELSLQNSNALIHMWYSRYLGHVLLSYIKIGCEEALRLLRQTEDVNTARGIAEQVQHLQNDALRLLGNIPAAVQEQLSTVRQAFEIKRTHQQQALLMDDDSLSSLLATNARITDDSTTSVTNQLSGVAQPMPMPDMTRFDEAGTPLVSQSEAAEIAELRRTIDTLAPPMQNMLRMLGFGFALQLRQNAQLATQQNRLLVTLHNASKQADERLHREIHEATQRAEEDRHSRLVTFQGSCKEDLQDTIKVTQAKATALALKPTIQAALLKAEKEETRLMQDAVVQSLMFFCLAIAVHFFSKLTTRIYEHFPWDCPAECQTHGSGTSAIPGISFLLSITSTSSMAFCCHRVVVSAVKLLVAAVLLGWSSGLHPATPKLMVSAMIFAALRSDLMAAMKNVGWPLVMLVLMNSVAWTVLSLTRGRPPSEEALFLWYNDSLVPATGGTRARTQPPTAAWNVGQSQLRRVALRFLWPLAGACIGFYAGTAVCVGIGAAGPQLRALCVNGGATAMDLILLIFGY